MPLITLKPLEPLAHHCDQSAWYARRSYGLACGTLVGVVVTVALWWWIWRVIG